MPSSGKRRMVHESGSTLVGSADTAPSSMIDAMADPSASGWPADTFVDIGGRRLRCWIGGEGSPPIVVESGMGSTAPTWGPLWGELAARSQVVVYDRAGLGLSDPDPQPRTPSRMIEDLRALISRLEIRRPVVLVGHSWGGLVARLYAHMCPAEVVGLVLVDATHEDSMTSRGAKMSKVNYRLLRFLARVHLLAPLLRRTGTLASFTEEQRSALLADVGKTMDGAIREASAIEEGLREMKDAISDSRLSIPVVVLSAGGKKNRRGYVARLYEKLHAQHASIADESLDGYHEVVKGSGHYIQSDKPEAVLRAIDHVITTHRSAPRS